jgi:hypothetical protein
LGLGTTEAARQSLTPEESRGIVQLEVDDRRKGATRLTKSGRAIEAADAARGADVLEDVLRSMLK